MDEMSAEVALEVERAKAFGELMRFLGIEVEEDILGETFGDNTEIDLYQAAPYHLRAVQTKKFF